jgi:hypothetical protein
VPIDITPQTQNGHDDLRDVEFLPHHVRGLQTEVVAVMNECLQELDRVGDLLRTLETPFAATVPLPREMRHAGDASRHDRDASPPARPSPSSPPAAAAAYGESRNVSDFDARLANLKRMLAEKLTDEQRS